MPHKYENGPVCYYYTHQHFQHSTAVRGKWAYNPLPLHSFKHLGHMCKLSVWLAHELFFTSWKQTSSLTILNLFVCIIHTKKSRLTLNTWNQRPKTTMNLVALKENLIAIPFNNLSDDSVISKVIIWPYINTLWTSNPNETAENVLSMAQIQDC